MKKIVALILLTAFAASSFYQSLVILDYRLNTAAFAKKCINRYRPQMHCNGQCLLMKKLRQQENKERKNPELKLQNKNEVISSRSFFAQTCSVHTATIAFVHPSSDKRTIGRPAEVFHPPCLS